MECHINIWFSYQTKNYLNNNLYCVFNHCTFKIQVDLQGSQSDSLYHVCTLTNTFLAKGPIITMFCLGWSQQLYKQKF